MPIEIYKGIVSHLSIGTDVHGSVSTSALTGKTSGSISSSNTYTFRLNGKAVLFPCSGPISLSNGDNVVAGGKIKKGQLEVHALKNATTSTQHTNYSVWNAVYGWFAVLFGLATSFILIGIPIFILGIWLLLICRTGKQTIQIVEASAPVEAAVA